MLGPDLEVFDASGGAGRSAAKGFGFIVGLATDDERPNNTRQFVCSGDNAFGFAEPTFETPLTTRSLS